MPLIELSDAVNVVEGYRDRNPDSWSLCNSIKFDIAELHTISPDEARGVGKWKLGGFGNVSDATEKWYDKLLQGGFLYCSACKCRSNAKTNYCPSCGARMTRAEAEKAMEVSEDA